MGGTSNVSNVPCDPAKRPVRRSVLGLLASTALFSAAPNGANAVDCTAPMSFTGDGACTNSRTLNYTVGGATPAIQATGNLDVTNTGTGQIGASGSGAVISAGGGLTLINAGHIMTLIGGSNSAVTSGNSQAGVTTIANSGFIGDEKTSGGGSIGIDAGNNLTSFTLTNTASGVIKSTSTTAIGLRTYAATSTIDNAGTISGFTAVGLYAGVSTLTNSGTISALATGLSRAITIQTGATATINNTASGTINGPSNVIVVNGTTTLTNDGTVSGTDEPTVNRGTVNYKPTIDVMSGGRLTLTNRGTITAKGAAIKVESGAASASITNSGTISATSTSAPTGVNVSGIVLDNPTGGTTVTNTGTISGTVHGIYVNSGAVTLSNSGTITGGTSAVFLNAGGSTFKIYDGAVFTNGIDYNNKTGNTTNFYTGSYTLGVKNYVVNSNTINLLGTGNQLITSGLTNGTGNIVVVAPTLATTPAAATAATVASASTVIGSVANTFAQPLPGVMPEAPTFGGTGLGFDAAPESAFAEPSRSAFPEHLFAGMDGSTGAVPSKARQGTAYDAWGNLAWVRGFGGGRLTPNSGGTAGNSSTSYGILFGYDRQVEDWRLGAYGGYGFGETRMLDGTGRLATDYYIGGLYARRAFGALTVLGNLTSGVMGNRSSRSINLGAEQAVGSFSGFFVAPELSLSYGMAIAPGWTLTPTLAGRYVGAFLPGYGESGSSQNVSYGANSAHSFNERAELKLTRSFAGEQGLTSSLYGQVAVLADQRAGSDRFDASVLGTSFAVVNPYARSTVGAQVGVGFDHHLTHQISAFGGLDGSLHSDRTSAYVGHVGLRMAF